MTSTFKWYGPQRLAEIRTDGQKRVARAAVLLRQDVVKSFQRTPIMMGAVHLITRGKYEGMGRRHRLRRGPGLGFRRVPSRPGEPPAIQIGTLISSIIAEHDTDRDGAVSRVGPMATKDGKSLKYARFLEFGTRKMSARPYLRPALQRAKARIAAVLRGGR